MPKRVRFRGCLLVAPWIAAIACKGAGDHAQQTPAPPPAARTPIEEAPHSAGFALESVPSGAEVYVDGKRRPERTPARIRDLPPGEHRIRLEHEAFEPWEAAVNLPRDVVLALPTAQLAGSAPATQVQSKAEQRCPLPKIPKWARTPVLPADLELTSERHSSRDGESEVRIRLHGTARADVQYRISQGFSSSWSCEYSVGGEELGFLDWAGLSRLFGNPSPPATPTAESTPGCTFDDRSLQNSIRAFGQRISPQVIAAYQLDQAFLNRIGVAAIGVRHWQGEEARHAFERLYEDVEHCIEFPAGAEVAMRIDARSGRARALQVATDDHSAAERRCMRAAIDAARFPPAEQLTCDLHVRHYLAHPKHAGAAGLLELEVVPRGAHVHLAGALRGHDSDLDAPLLFRPGKKAVALHDLGSDRRGGFEVEILPGRKVTRVVDARKFAGPVLVYVPNEQILPQAPNPYVD
jgi:hypothetical protein